MNSVKSLAALLVLSTALPLSANAGSSFAIISAPGKLGAGGFNQPAGFTRGGVVGATDGSKELPQSKNGFQLLYKFRGKKDGGTLDGGVIMDRSGNLYTTAQVAGAYDHGTVDKLSPDGKLTVLHAFSGSPDDGDSPVSALVMGSSGKLFGITYLGGTNSLGTVFEVSAAGNESVLHSFAGGNDGSYPGSTLIMDGSGNLYGGTLAGGQYGDGTIFKVTPAGTETVLHAFSGSDGDEPYGSVLLGNDGYLYGTTIAGGTYNSGTFFKLATDGSSYSVLYSFTGGADGGEPAAGLIEDKNKNFYSTTFGGGIAGCNQSTGCGVVYEFSSKGTESVLYSFTGGNDGGLPQAALARDKTGNFYGLAQIGGRGHCYANYTCGNIFRLAADGTFKILHLFKGSDGGSPIGDPILAGGYVYDTATAGGTGACQFGCGTIVRVKE